MDSFHKILKTKKAGKAMSSSESYTKLHSKRYQGGKEEAPEAYVKYVEEANDAANKVRI